MTCQTYQTPPELLSAIERRFGKLTFDLCATDGDEVLGLPHFTPEQDALKQEWPSEGHLWMNPPYRNIGPWVKKCAEYDGDARITALILASVDSLWWDKWVRPYAVVEALSPRVTFVGEKQGFNRMLAICGYSGPYQRAGGKNSGRGRVDLWRWKEDVFPKTILTAPVEGKNGPTHWAGPATAHVDLVTGNRVELSPPRSDQWLSARSLREGNGANARDPGRPHGDR